MTERRGSERVFLRIPITVQGADQNGKPFSEQTTTVEVNRDGARIGLKNIPRLGAEVRINNLVTHFAALFRVIVQCPQSYGNSPEWGMALTAPMPDLMGEFWGVHFADAQAEQLPHISALLLCRVCGRQELVAVSRAEYEVLRQSLALPRVCATCHRATEWEPSPPERGRAAPSPTLRDDSGKTVQDRTEAPAKGEAQRRGARRLAVRVPLLVSVPGGPTEETVSRDVSKTGLSFTTLLDVAPGDSIEVVVGHGIAAAPPTQRATIMWRRPETKGVKALIGVRFTSAEEAVAPGAPPDIAAKTAEA